MNVNVTVTKKAAGSSLLTIESLQQELGDGVVFIFGGITDAFGAAQDEMISVMRYIDNHAKVVSEIVPGILIRKSKIDGLFYDHSGTFREACTRTCQMHNFERVLVSLFDVLMGSQGLNYDMTSAQNLYRLNYYWVKFKAMVEALTTQSVGGDPNYFKKAPKEIRNLIGEIARTRWLSTERTTERLISLLRVEATEEFTNFIKPYLGNEDSDNWKAAMKYCVCIDSTHLSQFMLTFWYLANHTPGGKKGEGLVGCMKVLGFLGSPYQRVSIFIVASLYPIHLDWVKFSDRVSEIGIAAKAISTRSIENVLFERHFVECILCLSTDWRKVLPDANEFLISETSRAKALGLIDDEKVMVDYFDAQMKMGTEPMMEVTKKYFIIPGLRIGWSILQVVDPYVGPAAAAAILCALRKLGHINEDDSSCSDDILLLPDTDILGGPWTSSSETHAAPNISMRKYQDMIIEGYTAATTTVSQSVVKAYALSNTMIVNELKLIAKGNLKTTLIEHGKWPIDRHLKNYWDLFKEKYPALEDTLTTNFESRPITGTAAEQTFSLTGTQVSANNAACTNAKNMRHASDIKGAILRDIKDFRAAHIEGTRHRLLREKNSIHVYLSELVKKGEALASCAIRDGVVAIPTKRDIRGGGKKSAELIASLPHSMNEMDANAKKESSMAGSDALHKAIMDSSDAKLNGWDNMPEQKIDPLIESARKLTIAAIREKLLEYYQNDALLIKVIKKLKKGDNDVEDCLVKKIVEYWRENSIIPV